FAAREAPAALRPDVHPWQQIGGDLELQEMRQEEDEPVIEFRGRIAGHQRQFLHEVVEVEGLEAARRQQGALLVHPGIPIGVIARHRAPALLQNRLMMAAVSAIRVLAFGNAGVQAGVGAGALPSTTWMPFTTPTRLLPCAPTCASTMSSAGRPVARICSALV